MRLSAAQLLVVRTRARLRGLELRLDGGDLEIQFEPDAGSATNCADYIIIGEMDEGASGTARQRV